MSQETPPTGRYPAVLVHACPACGVVSVRQDQHTVDEDASPTGAEVGQARCPQCGYAGAETAVVWGREIRGGLNQ
jgi:hypothetical protein